MRNALLILLFLSVAVSASSQVSMTLQVPPTGVMFKPQLWNMILTNASAAREIEIDLVLTDIKSGQVVLTGSTNTVTLNNGTKQITSSDLAISYGYTSPQISDHDPNGYLAIGQFNACFSVIDKSGLHEYQILDDCADVIIEPLSPPMLNMPCDSCVAETIAPLFSWLPPAPLNLFSNLIYEMKLVELLPGQASSEAIQMNAPVLLVDGVSNPFLNYPSSGIPLDTSKLYAWQIIAKNNNEYASQSEIWVFKFSSLPKPDSAQVKDYIVYRNADEVKGIHMLQSDTLSIKYQHESVHVDTATIQLLDAKEAVLYTKEVMLVQGENFFVIPLPSSFKKKTVYSFRFLRSNQITTKMYFTQQ